MMRHPLRRFAHRPHKVVDGRDFYKIGMALLKDFTQLVGFFIFENSVVVFQIFVGKSRNVLRLESFVCAFLGWGHHNLHNKGDLLL